mmetsp:Transcript_4995/g.8334  ORF Transcript_4995/g.8334 Transcript_4995/m.8334 type:complete len:200 (-) Transcript_4995:244-843(-)
MRTPFCWRKRSRKRRLATCSSNTVFCLSTSACRTCYPPVCMSCHASTQSSPGRVPFSSDRACTKELFLSFGLSFLRSTPTRDQTCTLLLMFSIPWLTQRLVKLSWSPCSLSGDRDATSQPLLCLICIERSCGGSISQAVLDLLSTQRQGSSSCRIQRRLLSGRESVPTIACFKSSTTLQGPPCSLPKDPPRHMTPSSNI